MQHLARLSTSQQSAVLELIAQTTAVDGTPPIAEHILLHLRHGGDKSDSHLLIENSTQVIGYAHIDATDLVAGPSVELVVHQEHRKSGYGKDLLKPLAEACKKHRIKLGFYYSQAQDWHEPGGTYSGIEKGPHWDPDLKRDSLMNYISGKALPQVKEILENYKEAEKLYIETLNIEWLGPSRHMIAMDFPPM
mgnify:CR=1 FL=1